MRISGELALNQRVPGSSPGRRTDGDLGWHEGVSIIATRVVRMREVIDMTKPPYRGGFVTSDLVAHRIVNPH